MLKWLIRIGVLAGGAALARRLWRPQVESSSSFEEYPPRGEYHSAVSGTGDAVDHRRAPGVPPPDNDDYNDPIDHASADSFPASDPPSSW